MAISSDCFHKIAHAQTHSFSELVLDYLDHSEGLRPFYQYEASVDGVQSAIKARHFTQEKRNNLVAVLQEQYQQLLPIEKVTANIEALLDDNTYTVLTAHQPNLLTGPLYFIYKILHTVKLAEHLASQLGHNHFVPIFYIGSEDNDLEELGHFFFYGEQYRWDTQQTGAVGRMTLEDLQPLLHTLYPKMGPPGAALDRLQELIARSFSKENTIAQATQQFVHELLGPYGVVVLDPDHATLKAQYIHIMKDDLLDHTAAAIVKETSAKLSETYKSQAFVRDINLFYLKDSIRERIEKEGDMWKVLNTDIVFDQESLLQELETHPERFSPNVILRGMYQETILPNIAFIGGGSEVAYWMQLKDVFAHYKVDFPVLVLRQSLLLVPPATMHKLQQTQLPLTVVFQEVDAVIKDYTLSQNPELRLSAAKEKIAHILLQIQETATAIDPTLQQSAGAVQTKIQHQLHILSQKMLRAEKQQHTILQDRLHAIKAQLYPNGVMQERKQSFMDHYLDKGDELFDIIFAAIEPFGDAFVVVEM